MVTGGSLVRISVVGNSGSGKSTTAAGLARGLSLVHLELDALKHQADWKPLPREQFRTQVGAFLSEHHGWVIDGNYRSEVQDLVWAAADTVVWVDPGRLENLLSITWRTAARVVSREELWNGNRERWQNLVRLDDPEASMIAWAWFRHPVIRDRYLCAMGDPAFRHLRFVRLRSRRAAGRWVVEAVGRP